MSDNNKNSDNKKTDNEMEKPKDDNNETTTFGSVGGNQLLTETKEEPDLNKSTEKTQQSTLTNIENINAASNDVTQQQKSSNHQDKKSNKNKNSSAEGKSLWNLLPSFNKSGKPDLEKNLHAAVIKNNNLTEQGYRDKKEQEARREEDLFQAQSRREPETESVSKSNECENDYDNRLFMKINELKRQINTFKDKCKDAEIKLPEYISNNIPNQNENLRDRINSLINEILIIEEEKNNLKADLIKKESDKEKVELKVDLKFQKDTISELKKASELIEKDTNDLKERVNKLKENLDKIEVLKNKLVLIEDENNNLKVSLKEKTEEITTFRNKFGIENDLKRNLDKQVKENEDLPKIEDFKRKISTVNNENIQLKENIKEKEVESKNLEKEINLLREQSKLLTSTNQSFEKDNFDLKQDLDQQKHENRSLKTKLEQIISEILKIKTREETDEENVNSSRILNETTQSVKTQNESYETEKMDSKPKESSINESNANLDNNKSSVELFEDVKKKVVELYKKENEYLKTIDSLSEKIEVYEKRLESSEKKYQELIEDLAKNKTNKDFSLRGLVINKENETYELNEQIMTFKNKFDNNERSLQTIVKTCKKDTKKNSKTTKIESVKIKMFVDILN